MAHARVKTAARLEQLICRFVSRHSGRPRQRTKKWLQARAASIGGSELAAILGKSPYQSRDDIIKAKAGISPGWSGGNPACWWGTMFESIIERFTELDCNTTLHGTDISVPAPFEGHANSPDGYCVVALARGGDGVYRVATTEAQHGGQAQDCKAAPANALTVAVLVEFKCPYRRKPKGVVPAHYFPQIWSGLALSPVVQFALFIDAVFRKCSIFDLGPSRLYDYGYHRERNCWRPPVAWGLIGVYAPRLDVGREPDTEHDVAHSDARPEGCEDPAYEAWLDYYAYMAAPPEFGDARGAPPGQSHPDPIDLGDAESYHFNKALKLINRRHMRVRHLDPCFADRRPLGEALHGAREVGQAIDKLQAGASKGWYLWGFIPWKLLEAHYILVERRAGFLDEIRPQVQDVLGLVRQFRAAPNPALAHYNHQAQQHGRSRAQDQAHDAKVGRTVISNEDTQDFFDSI